MGSTTVQLTRLALLVALLVTAIVACGGPSTPPGAHKALGACAQGGYLFLRWQEGLEVMIWHDLAGEAKAHSTGFPSGRFYIERGSARSASGRSLAWEVHTTGGRLGEAQIGGVRYDLAAGTLFLVTTWRGATEVRQLSRNLSAVPLDHNAILAFAQEDPDLAAFLDEIPPASPPGTTPAASPTPLATMHLPNTHSGMIPALSLQRGPRRATSCLREAQSPPCSTQEIASLPKGGASRNGEFPGK